MTEKGRIRKINKLVRRVEHNADVHQSYVKDTDIRPSPESVNGKTPDIHFIFNDGSERFLLVFDESDEPDWEEIADFRNFTYDRPRLSFSWFWRYEI